jgi:hypothetical protein
MPKARWLGTVHHGLPADLLHPMFKLEGYLAFLGCISPEKGPDAAIRIVQRICSSAGIRVEYRP